MSRLHSTLINGDLTTTNTIIIPQKNVTWIDGFKNSPIKITDSIDSSNYTPWLIQCNTAFNNYDNYASFGTFINDITLAGIQDLDTNRMVRWWFNVNNGDFGISGSQKRLDNKNCYYINSSNYTNYMPTKTGSGASGTWNINISGTSKTITDVLPVSKGGTHTTNYSRAGQIIYSSDLSLTNNKKGFCNFQCNTKVSTYTFGVDETDVNPSSAAAFEVYNKNNNITIDTLMTTTSSTDSGIYRVSPRTLLICISTSGTITVNTSDRRKKLYIEDMSENETKVLLNVPIRNFIFKEDIGHNDLKQNGVFAQDLRELLKKNNIGNRPYLQWEYNDNDRDDVYYDINSPEKDDMTYSVSYNHMVPALIKGWQMQNKEIEELEKKLAILRIKKLNGLSS